MMVDLRLPPTFWTFEGGTIAFVISHNGQRNGYEIASLFPQPHDLPGR